MFGECPYLPVPTKAKIRTSTLDLNLADQHASIVPDIDTIAAGRVDIAKDIAFNAARRSARR